MHASRAFLCLQLAPQAGEQRYQLGRLDLDP